MSHATMAADVRGGARLRVRAAPDRAAGAAPSPSARRRPQRGRLSSLLRLLPALAAAAGWRPRASSCRRGGAGAALALALLLASGLLAAPTPAEAQTEVAPENRTGR